MIIEEDDDNGVYILEKAQPLLERHRTQAIEQARRSGAAFDAVGHVSYAFAAIDHTDTVIRETLEAIDGTLSEIIESAESLIRLVIETFRGHASRLAEESFDSIERFVRKVTDSAMGEIGAAEALMETGPARPVQSPEEAAFILQLAPLDAAGVMMEEKSSDGFTTLPEADQEPQPTQEAINQRIAEAVARFNQGMANGAAPGAAPQLVAKGPIQGGSCYGNVWEEIGFPEFYDPQGWASPQIFYVNQMIAMANWAKSRGGEALYVGPQYNDIDWGAVDAGYGASLGALCLIYDPIGDVTYTYSIDVQRARGLQNYELIALREAFPNFAEGLYPKMGIGPSCGNGKLFPGLQPSPPPPPPPPPPAPPPTLPPPASECCPPPPVPRGEFDPSIPLKREIEWFSKWGGICEYLNAAIDGLGQEPFVEAYAELGSDKDKKKARLPDFMEWIKEPAVGSQTEADLNRFAVGQQAVKKYPLSSLGLGSSQEAALAKNMALIAAANWTKTITGAPLDYFATPSEQVIRYLKPLLFPSQPEVNALYAANKIDDNQWECYTRSNGNIPEPARQVRELNYERLNIPEVVELYMRQEITAPQLDIELRKRGVVDLEAVRGWVKLREQIPQMPDIIRFMVRDVENETVVREGNLTEGFTDNFKGQLRKWAEQQGVTKEVALAQWKAHWELPSPTQANEMLRRLRPGRVPVDLEVNEEQIQRLYAAADYAPGWRKKMMAVSYNTPTRTDIKQGYIYGAFKRDEAREALLDTGLDKKGTEFVLKLLDTEKARAARVLSARDQLWTQKRILREYADGMITILEADRLLNLIGYPADKIDAAIESANIMRSVETRRKCIMGVRRKYYVGAIDDKTAIEAIRKLDGGFDAAPELVKQWGCERASGLQEVPARKNVEWAVTGVISIVELAARLDRLRYGPEDVNRFVDEALKRISEAQAKAAKAAIREAISDARGRLAEYRKQIQEREKKIKELEKKQKELEKNQPNNEE